VIGGSAKFLSANQLMVSVLFLTCDNNLYRVAQDNVGHESHMISLLRVNIYPKMIFVFFVYYRDMVHRRQRINGEVSLADVSA